MSIATPIDKFLSNHAIMLLGEVKDMKMDRRQKKAKTHDIKVSFDTVRSKSPQISSSFITKLNSELT